MSLLWAAVLVATATATDQRINLADFARVVKFVNDTPSTLDILDLESGADGWPVWIGEDGQSMIGLEWDEPRDIAEVEIEFRHAIADRDQIRVQYFFSGNPGAGSGGATATPDTFHGRWVTAKTDWWAGDRYVGFAFAPLSEELPSAGLSDITYRRTSRIRFTLGKRKDSLPAVRYLRAYGPAKAVEAKLEIRLDKLSPLRPPLRVRVVNGLLIDDEGETTRSAMLEVEPRRMRVRYAEQDWAGASRTVVTVSDESNRSKGLSFLPAEVVERGLIGIPSLGVSIVHVGTTKDLSTRSKPATSVYERVSAGFVPTVESEWREVAGEGMRLESPLTPELREWADTRYRGVLGEMMTIESPVQLLNDFYQAEMVRLLASADGVRGNDVVSLRAFGESARPVASCAEARALGAIGVSDAVEVFLNGCFALQPAPRPVGRFGPKGEGFLGTPRPEGERFDRSTLEHGAILDLAGRHYRLTRDRRWLTRNAAVLKAGCDFVLRQSKGGSDNNTLDKDDELWGRGLLPPGPIAGTTAWAWWLPANAWCARGMRMCVGALADVNDPGAGSLAGEIATFEQHVAHSCREAMLRAPVVALADAEHVPMQPIRSRFRGREPDAALAAAQGPVHLLDCGTYSPDSPEADWILRDSEENLWPAVGPVVADRASRSSTARRFLQYCAESPAGLPGLVPVYLQRGQHRHALKVFNSLLASVLRTRASSAGSLGSDDGGGLSAGLLVWMREMFVRENDRKLELLAGVPSDWLARGKTITVQRAPTWFGTLDMTVESAADANRITVKLVPPTRQPPEVIHLWLRAPRQLRSVTRDGRQVATFDPASGLIRLQAGPERTEIVVDY